MKRNDNALDAFIDDCFLDEDPICSNPNERSLELIASRLISELVPENNDDLIAS
ncbi:hypothetical protein [Prochlorococcus sp. MIT 1341]|uniref:hypothetical protein n=1 Tax=Prochlorococcus sp. MIT 1341 TaxID=3096221 RepID=UPI002A75A046|nr:hypothetical protein [Prochlorococcus sp. MIT 1341]